MKSTPRPPFRLKFVLKFLYIPPFLFMPGFSLRFITDTDLTYIDTSRTTGDNQ